MDSQMLSIPTWFLPSFFGDVRIEAETETSCTVITTQVTPQEREALAKLEVMAKKKGWRDTAIAVDGRSTLRAPVEKVAKTLAKLLKPGRTVISAVKFSDGTMEEVRDAGPYRKTSSTKEPTTDKDPVAPPKPKKKPKAAVSTAVPVRGCPPPDFPQSEIRAQRVLAAFLTTDQLDDFKRFQRFMSTGSESGHRYMITSRLARDQLAVYTRSLYDLDLQSPICAHDFDVPPAEEMLGFHILLQMPGWERYLNEVTDDNHQTLLSGLGAI